MMRHRFKESLLKKDAKELMSVNDNASISTIDIFEELPEDIIEDTYDYVREFDFEVHLDNLEGNEIPTPAIFVKGEMNASVLNAYIFKSNIPVNLSDVIVSVNIKEARGKTTIFAEVVDINGVVKINLPSSTIDEVGINSFELVFQSGQKTIISPTYTYKVLNSLGSGSLGTSNEKTTLQTLIEQVQGSKDVVDDITNELEIVQSDIDEIISMIGGS